MRIYPVMVLPWSKPAVCGRCTDKTAKLYKPRGSKVLQCRVCAERFIKMREYIEQKKGGSSSLPPSSAQAC